jgi:hypothetical protein
LKTYRLTLTFQELPTGGATAIASRIGKRKQLASGNLPIQLFCCESAVVEWRPVNALHRRTGFALQKMLPVDFRLDPLGKGRYRWYE